MLYFALLLIILLCGFIFFLVRKNNISKEVFKSKIDLLESIIFELNANLEYTSQKVKLSEDLKMSLQVSNKTLSTKIVDMNMEMFGEMFDKK